MIFPRSSPWFVSVEEKGRFQGAIYTESVSWRYPFKVRLAGGQLIGGRHFNAQVDLRKPFQLRHAGGPREFFLSVDLRKPIELRHARGPRETFICLAGDQLIFRTPEALATFLVVTLQVDLRKPFELRHAGGPREILI